MQNLLSVLLLTLSALNPFGSTVQSGQSIISSQTTTVENQSQIVTQEDLETEFWQRVSQIRPWITPKPTSTPIPTLPIPPTPLVAPTPPPVPTSPSQITPTPTPILTPIEFNRLDKHRL